MSNHKDAGKPGRSQRMGRYGRKVVGAHMAEGIG